MAYRSQGNILYFKATNVDMVPLLKIGKIEEALRFYEKGKNEASRANDKEEWLSCVKSLGVASSKLASMEDYQERNSKESVMYWFKNALENYSACLSFGVMRDNKWKNQIKEKLKGTVDNISGYLLRTFDAWQPRCAFIEKVLQLALNRTGQAVALTSTYLNLVLMDEMNKAIVILDERKNWRAVLHLCEEANRPLNEIYNRKVRVLNMNDPLLTEFMSEMDEEIEEFEKSRDLYKARAFCAKYRSMAGSNLTSSVFGDESLNMELVWDAVDFYCAAITSLRKSDYEEDNVYFCYESLAITTSALGKVYETVLKMNDRSHPYLLQCVQYADIVSHTSGATFFSQSWYKFAQQTLEAHRRKREAFDAAEVARQREPILTELKADLDAIETERNKCSGLFYKAHAVLTHIYEKHPPKKEDHTLIQPLDRDDESVIKRAIRNAAVHYHPDKNKNHGMKWFVLAEEISKILNGFHSELKGF